MPAPPQVLNNIGVTTCPVVDPISTGSHDLSATIIALSAGITIVLHPVPSGAGHPSGCRWNLASSDETISMDLGNRSSTSRYSSEGHDFPIPPLLCLAKPVSNILAHEAECHGRGRNSFSATSLMHFSCCPPSVRAGSCADDHNFSKR